MITRFCLLNESHEGPNSYNICRPSILGNPYSHLPEDKCIALYRCKTREEAIDSYSNYFDTMYGSNLKFTNAVNEIYEKYKRGENIYLGCFCPKSMRCHGDIIIEKLQKMLIKEKLRERRIFK
jgi:hypothetical protein